MAIFHTEVALLQNRIVARSRAYFVTDCYVATQKSRVAKNLEVTAREANPACEVNFLSSTAKFKSLFALIIDFDEHITLKLFKCTRRKTKSETL